MKKIDYLEKLKIENHGEKSLKQQLALAQNTVKDLKRELKEERIKSGEKIAKLDRTLQMYARRAARENNGSTTQPSTPLRPISLPGNIVFASPNTTPNRDDISQKRRATRNAEV